MNVQELVTALESFPYEDITPVVILTGEGHLEVSDVRLTDGLVVIDTSKAT